MGKLLLLLIVGAILIIFVILGFLQINKGQNDQKQQYAQQQAEKLQQQK